MTNCIYKKEKSRSNQIVLEQSSKRHHAKTSIDGNKPLINITLHLCFFLFCNAHETLTAAQWNVSGSVWETGRNNAKKNVSYKNERILC